MKENLISSFPKQSQSLLPVGVVVKLFMLTAAAFGLAMAVYAASLFFQPQQDKFNLLLHLAAACIVALVCAELTRRKHPTEAMVLYAFFLSIQMALITFSAPFFMSFFQLMPSLFLALIFPFVGKRVLKGVAALGFVTLTSSMLVVMTSPVYERLSLIEKFILATLLYLTMALIFGLDLRREVHFDGRRSEFSAQIIG